MISRFFLKIWWEAMAHNIDNILSLLNEDPKATVLDVGCGDGQVTIRYKEKIKSEGMVGIDGVRERLVAAKKKGVDKVVFANLDKKWPFKNCEFDVVISNQVIEHVIDIDNFIEETFRVLKPGGYCVISTENLSSWHNIFALILGFQDFSHHIIKKRHVSNPLSLHYGERTCTWSKDYHSGVDDTAYPHIKIMTFKSLINSFCAYDFEFEKGKGSGYYPIFGYLSFFASWIDPFHSHFITIKMRKPKTLS